MPIQAELTTMNINHFPVELHHEILCFMDPEDILAIRQTSKYFLALTQEPRLWTAVYHCMQQIHLLDCSQHEFTALAPWKAERLLVRASKTEKLFGTFREHAQHRIFPGRTGKTGRLRILSFLSERFLLSVDDMTVVCVWDVLKPGSSVETSASLYARLTLVGWHFVIHTMTTDQSTLYVVCSSGSIAHIFSLSLPSTMSDTSGGLSFHDEASFDLHPTKVGSIDMDSGFLLSDHRDVVIQVMDWRMQRRSTFRLHQAFEGLSWNCVLALRVCGPYILCFRSWSIEAYPIPYDVLTPVLMTEQPLPVLRHVMPDMEFLRISLSRIRHVRFPTGDVYALCVLAESRCCRIYHYQVQVHLYGTPAPSLSVRLLGVGARAARRVSAQDLGPSGLRGAWVHKSETGDERHVVAFTASPSRCPIEPLPVEDGTLDVPPQTAPRIMEQAVAVVSDGDVAACAVSEFTGRIALGSRTGTITVI